MLPLAGVLPAQDDVDSQGPRPTAGPAALAQYKANLATHKDNAAMLVLPGLVADRKARTVAVLAEATGVSEGDIAEFLLVDQGSSHGYESLLWSFAKPSDVHRALEFIGLKPGSPFNPVAIRFWSDGDRVNVAVRGDDGETVPIERLILDREADASLPEEGFVFAGSIMVPARDGKGPAGYAADIYDPRSVASIYNEPAAVLDVPRQAPKGEVYGNQVVNPEYSFAGGELLTLVMTPRDPAGTPPARELVLSIDGAAVSNGVVCRLSDAREKVLHETPSVHSMLERLRALHDDEAECYVELSFGDGLRLTDVSRTSELMVLMETMGLVKLKPPAVGELYYRAFVPNKDWLKPEGRPSQPWELHLHRKDGALAAQMVLYEPVWTDDSQTPTFKRSQFDLSGPHAVHAKLAKDTQERQAAGRSLLPPVLLVFADPELTYVELMPFITPILPTHGTVYVFVDAPAQDAPDDAGDG